MAASEKKGRELLRLRRALSRAEQALAEADKSALGPAQLCASDLEILDRLDRKGPTPVNTLAPRVGLTSGSMTTAVQRLLRRGLVERERDGKDKRIVQVSITQAGSALAAETKDARIQSLETTLEGWSNREQNVLAAFLKRLRKDAQSPPHGNS